MRAVLECKHLVEALGLAQTTAARSDTVPVLRNVLLQADGERLSVTTTNLKCQLTTHAHARVEAAGGVTAPIAMFHNLARAFPAGGEVLLDDALVVGARLSLRCGRSSYELPTLPATDFPRLAAPDEPLEFELAVPKLKRLLAGALPSASTDETKYYAQAVNLRRGPHGLRAEATDGLKVALFDEPSVEVAGFESVSISLEAAGGMLRLLASSPATGMAHLRVQEALVTLTTDAGELVGRVQDARYPDVQRFWPAAWEREISCDLPLFSACMKRAAMLADGKSAPVRADFEPGKLTLSATSLQFAQGEEVLEVEYDGAPLRIAFNARNLSPLLDQLGGETLRLRLNGPTDPFSFNDDKDPHCEFLAVPVRTGA